MAVRFMILPIEVVGSSRGPKYFVWRFGTGTLTSPWSMFDYGLQATALVAADLSPADLSFLQLQSDVQLIPANIDSNVSAGALATVRSGLEALWIPGNWVQTSNTYRQVIRVVAGLFQFAQRYNSIANAPLMTGTPNLDLTLGDLSAQRRTDLQSTADSFGYDTSSFTLATTLRTVLKFLGDAWGSATFQFGSIATL